jgi:hypothetical protein
MTLLSVIFYTIGFFVFWWFVLGIALFAFGAKVYIHPSAPWSARIFITLKMAMIMPYHMVVYGSWPVVVLAPADDPEAVRAARLWWAKQCGCPECRKVVREEGGNETSSDRP